MNVNQWLAILRIYTGLFWGVYGVAKYVRGVWFKPGGEYEQVVKGATAQTSGPIHNFAVNVALAHPAVFANLIAMGETLVGISLFLGLLTRAGAVGGMFLALTYWLVLGEYSHYWGVDSLEAVAFALSFFNFVLPTAAVWSADRIVFKRNTQQTTQGL